MTIQSKITIIGRWLIRLIQGKDGANYAEKVDFLEVDNDVEAKKQQISKQAELTADVIQHWQQKKKKDISENPANFYTEEK